jgi:hypothetical protein
VTIFFGLLKHAFMLVKASDCQCKFKRKKRTRNSG